MLVRPRRMAQLLECSVQTLRRYRQDGILTPRSVFKGRRLVRYDPDQVRAELDAHFGQERAASAELRRPKNPPAKTGPHGAARATA